VQAHCPAALPYEGLGAGISRPLLARAVINALVNSLLYYPDTAIVARGSTVACPYIIKNRVLTRERGGLTKNTTQKKAQSEPITRK
jgi:hypothetical protein